jgi:hypothetical protein
MRKAFAAAALAVALTVGAVPQADAAGSPGCVSRTEFRSVKRGYTKQRVHRVFETTGRQESWYSFGGDRYESRRYKACTKSYGYHGTVYVDYKNGTLRNKMAFW